MTSFWRGFCRGYLRANVIGWPIAVAILIVARCAPAPAFAASCPDWDVPATSKVRVQFQGPCSAPAAFIHAVIDVGVAVQNISAASPGIPYQLEPDECAWIPRRWVGCLRSRCVGATADVDPGEFSSPRGTAAAPARPCVHTWGHP